MPKAHVEAPVSGSIILAGSILKLGGYGLFLVRIIYLEFNLVILMIVISLCGGAIVGVNIARVTDIKVMIAYSSVVHISIVCGTMLRGFFMGIQGALIIIVGHGLISSAIFRGAYLCYIRSHRQSLIINKGVLRKSPSFRLF